MPRAKPWKRPARPRPDAGLRARLDVIWASTVLAQGTDATRDARLEAIRILGQDSNPQIRQEADAAGGAR